MTTSKELSSNLSMLKQDFITCYGCSKVIKGKKVYMYGWLCIDCYNLNFRGTINHELYRIRKLFKLIWLEIKKSFT